MGEDLRIGGYVPQEHRARQLWADGLRERELLEYVEARGTDRAWAEHIDPRLTLGLAALRGASTETLVLVARGWWRAAQRRSLVSLPPEAAQAVDAAHAPDVDASRLLDLVEALRAHVGRRHTEPADRLVQGAILVAALGLLRGAHTRIGVASVGERLADLLGGAVGAQWPEWEEGAVRYARETWPA